MMSVRVELLVSSNLEERVKAIMAVGDGATLKRGKSLSLGGDNLLFTDIVLASLWDLKHEDHARTAPEVLAFTKVSLVEMISARRDELDFHLLQGVLTDMLCEDPSHEVRCAVARVLADVGVKAIPALLSGLDANLPSDSPMARTETSRSLERVLASEPQAIGGELGAKLERIVRDPSELAGVRRSCQAALSLLSKETRPDGGS